MKEDALVSDIYLFKVYGSERLRPEEHSPSVLTRSLIWDAVCAE